MARYIDADKVHEFVNAKVIEGKDGWAKGVPYEWAYALTVIDNQPTADVVPKSEVEKWKNAAKIANKEREKLSNHYFIDTQIGNGTLLQRAKQEFASEIFAEIDKELDKARIKYRNQLDSNGVIYTNYARAIIAELKKKYSEGEPLPAPEEKYFSPQDVRNMTPKEVHDNYTAILRSMERW